MTVIIATIIVFAVALLALGVGVLLGRRPLQGSCGGIGQCACGATSVAECQHPTGETP